jgi:hypothetical protein
VRSCNTAGVNGKQGGYWYDWCANVTINPNLDGCYETNSDTVRTHASLLESGIKIVSHHATDEEHEAAKASLLERERAQDLDIRSDFETIATVSTDNEINITADITADRSIEKRDTSLVCFDGGTDGICYYCTCDTA